MAYLFEIHLTVDSLTIEQLPHFEQFCQNLGGQAVLIQLPVGEHTQQPMFTVTKSAENLSAILTFIDRLKPQFLAENFSIIRTKIEIPTTQVDDFLAQYPDTKGYFEWHGKVQFHGGNDALQTLRYIPQQANVTAHISKNALAKHDDIRYITYRNDDAQAFNQSIEKILDTLKNRRTQRFSDMDGKVVEKDLLVVQKQQSEYCVYDDALSLDNGWIKPTENSTSLMKKYRSFYKDVDEVLIADLIIHEALIRRTAHVNQSFMLKGSYITRQYFDELNQRFPFDVDFVCLVPLHDEHTATQVLNDWLIEVTRLDIHDGVYFEDFAENAFWRRIDYAMHDDFPTVLTDIVCYIDGKKHEIMLEVSFNLDIPFEPVSLLYKTPIDTFVYPKTVPLPLQLAWKIHQSIVRPRLKDIYDLTYLVKKVNNPQIVQDTLQALLQECQKDGITLAEIKQFFHYQPDQIFSLGKGQRNTSLQQLWNGEGYYDTHLDKAYFPLRSDDMHEFFAEFKQNMQQAGFSLENLDLDNLPFFDELQASQQQNPPIQQPQPLTLKHDNLSSSNHPSQVVNQVDNQLLDKNAKIGFLITLLILGLIGIWVMIQLKFNLA